MNRKKQSSSLRRGISFGTIFMTAFSVLVLGLSAAVFPRLLSSSAFDMNISGAVAALTLDDSLTALSLSDIPINAPTATPAPEMEPQKTKLVSPATPAPTATPIPGGKVTLTIGGSVNIDDAVRKSAYYSDSKKYDFTEIMMLLKDEMKSDITLVTLENLTCDSEKVSSINAPSVVMDMLAQSGVDIVSLGYSQALDKGLEALQKTIGEAQKRGLATLGAYANQADADALRMFKVNNVNVAFLHYTESISSSGKKIIRNQKVDYALPTTLVEGTPDAMLAGIRRAKEKGADVIIVTLNWGKNGAKPTAAQSAIAQQLADAGADVIIGTGSKIVQPVTWLTSRKEDGNIRHTLCAWNLASLLTGERNDGNVCGMLLQLQIAFDGDSISFEKVCYTPTYIWRYKQDGQYHYRIAVSDQPAPDGMAEDQIGYMEKALRNLQKYLGDSPVTLRDK